MSDLFRKKSLDKLSSPEQLDRLMKVTDAKGWAALTALCGLVIAAVLWGIFIRIPEKVAGQGLFIRPGGLLEITAPSSGQIKDIYIQTGDIVKKGYPIARITQKELLEDIKIQRKALDSLEEMFRKRSSSGQKESALASSISFETRKALREKVNDLRSQYKWLSEKAESQEKLLAEGLITKQTLIDTKSALAAIQQQIYDAENSQTQADLTLHQQFNQNDRDLESLMNEIEAKEREIERKNMELETASKVLSPYTCRIVEMNTYNGSQIAQGTPIAKIELIDNSIKTLEAVVYFPADKGSRIKQGMKMMISPSTVKQEEHGFILGIVTSVSEFPSSSSSMMSVLHNDSLVKTFTAGGTPVEVRADLIPDPKTPSGYKWSSGRGAEMRIETGTLCGGTVVVDEKRPISLVIPIIKKYLAGN